MSDNVRPLRPVDNLDAAQALINRVDVLSGVAEQEGGLELVSGLGGQGMTVDTALMVAVGRTLVDIARSLRGLETCLGEFRQ